MPLLPSPLSFGPVSSNWQDLTPFSQILNLWICSFSEPPTGRDGFTFTVLRAPPPPHHIPTPPTTYSFWPSDSGGTRRGWEGGLKRNQVRKACSQSNVSRRWSRAQDDDDDDDENELKEKTSVVSDSLS